MADQQLRTDPITTNEKGAPMKIVLPLAFCAVLLVTPAAANDAMDKCVADTTSLDAKDPEGGCTCFVDSISEEAADAYAAITDWETEATDEMKDAGAACFPDLQ